MKPPILNKCFIHYLFIYFLTEMVLFSVSMECFFDTQMKSDHAEFVLVLLYPIHKVVVKMLFFWYDLAYSKLVYNSANFVFHGMNHHS